MECRVLAQGKPRVFASPDYFNSRSCLKMGEVETGDIKHSMFPVEGGGIIFHLSVTLELDYFSFDFDIEYYCLVLHDGTSKYQC